MTKKQVKSPANYIEPLNMNRLRGRMLRLAPTRGKNREILLVYGHHSSLEAIFPMAQELNKYGGVTVPDMPGFGGMQSFYRLGDKPTVDNLADYLAAFVKLFYKRRRLTVIGISFGFAVVTRMLQKYPELAKRVDLLVSIGGYSRYDDFNTTTRGHISKYLLATVFSQRLPATLAQKLFLKPVLVKSSYTLMAKTKQSKQTVNSRQIEKHAAQTMDLWHKNDLRTYMSTTKAVLSLDICKNQISLPLYHFASTDRYFNNDNVEQHLNVIYSSVEVLDKSRPKSTAKLSQLPTSLQSLLRKSP